MVERVPEGVLVVPTSVGNKLSTIKVIQCKSHVKKTLSFALKQMRLLPNCALVGVQVNVICHLLVVPITKETGEVSIPIGPNACISVIVTAVQPGAATILSFIATPTLTGTHEPAALSPIIVGLD